jgi:hypothetical protein
MIHPPVGTRSENRRRRGVPPASGHGVDDTDRPIRARHESVDQRRLADAGMTDRDRGVPGERGRQLVQGRDGDTVLVLRAAEHRDVEPGEVRQERLGVGPGRSS